MGHRGHSVQYRGHERYVNTRLDWITSSEGACVHLDPTLAYYGAESQFAFRSRVLASQEKGHSLDIPYYQ